MQDLLDFTTEIAEKAGEITLKYFGKKIDVESKADDSPVTVADRESEEYLRAEIEKRFPEDGILGEEFGEKAGTSSRRSDRRDEVLYSRRSALRNDGGD